MDYINHVKQSPMMGVIGYGGGATSLGRYSGAADGEFIDNMFGIEVRAGTSGTKQVTNGVNLSADGGLVITKVRTATGGPTEDFTFVDTVRGAGKLLASDEDHGEYIDNGGSLSSFNTDGYTIPAGQRSNYNTGFYVDWCFKKQEKFFDCVQYTGDGNSGRTVAHNLGSVPGSIWIKRTDTTGDWQVYHRSVGNTKYMILNKTDSEATATNRWNNTTPTDSVFTLGNSNTVNSDGGTYMAYIFAHEEDSFGVGGDNTVISCSKYTGNGSNDGPTVTLGWEPSLLIVKRMDGTATWYIVDMMRGWSDYASGVQEMYLNDDAFETDGNWCRPRSTGFKITSSASTTNDNGHDYLYIAVRRPDGLAGKPKTGSEVLTMVAGSANLPMYKTPNHFVDFTFQKSSYQSGTADWSVTSRLLNKRRLESNTNIDMETNQYQEADYSDGWGSYTGGDGTRFGYLFKRHAGLDVVTYQGTTTVNHSLGVRPEMVWIKQLDGGSPLRDWVVGCPDILGIDNNTLALNQDYAKGTSNVNCFATSAASQTATQVVLHGNENGVSSTSRNFMMVLFASVSGVSKIGTYDGAAGSVTVTCGFQPRMIMIKVINTTEDWLIFDTVRGIAAGNDYRLRLNRDSAEVSSSDWVDLTSDGFIANNTGSASIGGSGNSFLFYAHA